MATLGFPGTFPGGLTTGFENIGAVQKQKTNATLGFFGVAPGGLTTGYRGIGAIQKDLAATNTTTERERGTGRGGSGTLSTPGIY